MKKQLLAGCVCLLLLGLLPLSVLGAQTVTPSTSPAPTELGRTIVRGLVFGYKDGGAITRFFAIRIHYTEIIGTQTTIGVIRLRMVNVGDFIGGYSHEFAVKGFFTYLFGATFHGGIN